VTYPLSVPVASHSSLQTTIANLPVVPIVKVGLPPTRTANWTSSPYLSSHARSSQTTIAPLPVVPIVKVGLPPVRVWAGLIPLSNFTFPTYGQWIPRAARDRP
jgi:hypothetical protein